MNNAKDPYNDELEQADNVVGERKMPSVTKGQSLQSKLNNIFAIGVIIMLGGGFLTWYYSNLTGKQKQLDEAKRKQQEQLLQNNGSLPKLGAVPFPNQSPTPTTPPEAFNAGNMFGPPPEIADNAVGNNSQPKPKTPEELAVERRLNTPVYVKTGLHNGVSPSGQPTGRAVGQNTALAGNVGGNTTPLGDALKPTTMATARAQMLPSMTYLIPKGRKGDCTLETAIDSQLPGLVTCVLAYDIFGADGKVPLLKRGTAINGETRANVQQGQSRLFVIWTEARTEHGVIAQLDSPATDSLGRSGIAGEVDNHFWDRFGAAILISVINGAIQAGTNYASGAGNSGGTTLNYNTQQPNSVMTEVLRNTVNIPPTINIPQGERVQILFARDVDFRPVYSLEDKYQYIYDEAAAKYSLPQ
ncbi:type IV secretion system protein VirB10 (plasmid) [Methylomonas sp. EFPC1]|uniref:type IV secretion system protein VirB10 n=1 Tax=Methylomonas sp. EFPC1 TaxID=2812647 RepID=UPI0019675E97|nr:type IV secretion system protein VirB10 [Methylomonas sp. EFPC1]QSB03791.1 type IV secretion system protein VirB10 [Methylomonas sp. EFPC1]